MWTNTCCSHPLVGQKPEEVDQPDDVADGTVPGVKNAAVRKLDHELGIQGLSPSSFRFLTRLHYCAADTLDCEWGEHEIDYILFARCPPDMKLTPNPEEVDDVRFVYRQELEAMMLPSSGLSWSPWFRIIAKRLLPAWWGDLESAISTDKFADRGTIHRLS